MHKGGFVLGGEQSGHIINLNHNPTGDGLCAALQVMLVMKSTGKKLSELAGVMTKYPQVLKNVRVSNERKDEYKTNSEIMSAVAELETRLGDEGRVLVRSSGTEPLVRVMIEGADLNYITKEAEVLAALVQNVLS